MRVALLSAGPSLQASYGPAVHDHDLTIGVNTAVRFFPVDWWACADRHRFIAIDEKGIKTKGKGKKKILPKLFMIDAQHHDAQAFNAEQINRYEFTGWKEVFAAEGASMSWANFTAIGALILAKWLGATELDVYGVDLAGNDDCTGEVDDSTKYREPARWMKERALWHLVVDWIKNRGVQVNQHHATQPC